MTTMKRLIGSAAAKFAALILGCAALCATTVHAGGFDGKPLTTNDWFDVGFTAGTSITANSDTGFARGAGSWTAVPADGVEIVDAATDYLSIDADDLLTLTPAALASSVSNETVAVKVKANVITSLDNPEDTPIAAFALYDNGTSVTPVAYVDGGWTNLVYANAADLTNAWFTLYIDFSNDNGQKSVRFSVQPDGGAVTVLKDSQDATWFTSANSATKISSLSFSGSGLCETISGDSYLDAVAQVNGVNYATFADAITAANAAGVSTITILDGTTVSPDAGWKVVNGQLVKKVYVAQIVGGSSYETIAEAISEAQNGDTINVFAGTFDAGSSTITIDKSVTITGAGKDATTLTSAVSGKGLFSIAADNVTIQNLTISLSANADSTRGICIGNKPQANVVSNITLQGLKFVGGRNALSVYASNLTIDSCEFSEQYRDAILLYTVQGTSAISNSTFVQMTPGGNAFIYGTDTDNDDPLSSGNLTISGNTATAGRGLYQCNNQLRFDTSAKLTLEIINNVATNYNNKAIVFAGHSDIALGTIFNSVTITNNVLFTPDKRPTIQRDDSDTSFAIDASYNYWGEYWAPDYFKEIIPGSGDKMLVMGDNITYEPYYQSFDPETGVLSNLYIPACTVTFQMTDAVGKMQLPSRDSSVYTDVTGAWNNGVNNFENQIIAFTQTVTSGGTATRPTKVPRYQIDITQPNNGSPTTFTAEMRNAYTFDGWATADGELYDFSTPVTENLTLHPRFSATGATITISNEADLLKFAREVELGRIFCLDDEFRSQVTEPRQTVQLAADITLTSAWTPIASTFRGILDGNNRTISGLTINSTDNDVGFFKSTGSAAVVKDLTFAAPTVYSTGEYVGVLAGKASKNTQVSNVNVTGAFGVSGQNNVGALFGRANDGVQIEDCDITGTSATVTANGSDGRPVGGLLGDTSGAVSVTDCSVSGVTVTGCRKIGGLIGQQNGGTLTCNNVSVSNVTLHTNATTSYDNTLTMGGLIGIFAGSYSNSSMTGTVSDLTMTGPESIASGKNYVMGWVSGGTGGTVAAAATAMSGASMTFDVTVSGTNTRTVSNDSTYAGINGNPSVTYVAQIVRNDEVFAQYETLAAAIAAAVDGDTIELLCDIELDAKVSLTKTGTYVIDGKGFTISMADGANFAATSNGAFVLGIDGGGSAADIAVKNYTLKNLTVTGFNSEFIRCEGCTLTLDNCDFTKNDVTTDAGRGKHLIRIAYSTVTFQGCTITENTASDYGVVYIDENLNNIRIDNCLVASNAVSATAIIDVAHSESVMIADCSFIGNTVNSSNNGAVIYLGSKDDPTDNGGDCVGCLFKDNVVNYSTTTGYDDRVRVAGAIFTWAYGENPGIISGNAFVNNSVVKQNANYLNCYAKSIFSGGKYNAQDLAGNYFGGSAPVIAQDNSASSGNDIYAEESTYTVTASSFAYSYTLNADNYGVSVVLGKMVTFELDGTAPAGATAPATGAYAVDSALPLPTYSAENASFAGWQVKNSDPAVVVSTLPADIASPVTFVATWTVVKSVQVTEGVSEAQSIKVTEEWLEEKHINKDDAGAIQTALNATDTNGLPAWQNYVLGQDPDADVKADAGQGAVDAMPVVSTVTPQTVDTGFKVEYRVDEVNADGSAKTGGEGALQDTPALTVDLTELTPENNVAYYKTVAVITSTSDENVTVTVESTNTVGVLAITDAPAKTIIPVPWESLADGENISVSNLVRTATLAEGDQIQAYDAATDTYKSWTLNAAKEWVPDTVSSKTDTVVSPGSDAYTVPRGAGVWLLRGEESANNPIYLVGEVPEGKATAALAAGTSGKPSWNLVGNPTAETSQFPVTPKDGDQILVPTGDGLPVNYTYDAAKSQWYRYETVPVIRNNVQVGVRRQRVYVDSAAISAGTGFWYLNTDGAKNVEW